MNIEILKSNISTGLLFDAWGGIEPETAEEKLRKNKKEILEKKIKRVKNIVKINPNKSYKNVN